MPSVKGLRFKSEVHHEGVVEFFHKAADNGYTIIYLTARPIDFDSQTRKYLFHSLQDRDGGYSLPESALFSGAKVNVEECGVNERVSYNPSIVKSSTIQTIIDLFDLREKVKLYLLLMLFNLLQKLAISPLSEIISSLFIYFYRLYAERLGIKIPTRSHIVILPFHPKMCI